MSIRSNDGVDVWVMKNHDTMAMCYVYEELFYKHYDVVYYLWNRTKTCSRDVIGQMLL